MTAPTASASGIERLWESPVGSDLAFLLARANALSLGAMSAALAPHGLKVRSFSVLSLACAETPPSQREMSEFLRLDPSQIVSLVDELESRGLVVRDRDPRDRRANVVVATDAGRVLCGDARTAAEQAEKAQFDALPDGDVARVSQLLRHLAGAPEPAPAG